MYGFVAVIILFSNKAFKGKSLNNNLYQTNNKEKCMCVVGI